MNSRMGQAAAAYRQAAASVHPTVAVVKLYDATLLAISQAIRAREAGQFEECFIKVMRAATILRGLDHALDYARGGAVAERLHRASQVPNTPGDPRARLKAVEEVTRHLKQSHPQFFHPEPLS